MKKSKHLWVSIPILLLCGASEINFQLPDNLYTINKVYDIGNNGNAADIRVHVDYSAATISNLLKVRLVVVKSSKSFVQAQITSLPSGNFFEVPLSIVTKQVIKPATTLKDSDGDAIANGSYKAYIAIIGKNVTELSAFKDFVLANKPIFAGDYIGTWEDLGPPGPAKFPMSLHIADDYSGRMFYANDTFKPYGAGTQDALTTMNISGTSISSFTLNQFIEGYKGGCPANKNLTGHFNDDIELVFETFEWADCDGKRNVILKFTKQ